jgi:hypothetical protein
VLAAFLASADAKAKADADKAEDVTIRLSLRLRLRVRPRLRRRLRLRLGKRPGLCKNFAIHHKILKDHMSPRSCCEKWWIGAS